MIILKNTIYSRINQAGGGGGGFSNTKSLAFDGVDEHVDCGNISALANLTEATWMGWFKRGGSATYYIMSTWGFTGSTRQFSVLQTPTQLTVYMALGGFGNQRTMFTNTSLTFTTDVWYHLAFVYNEAESDNADKMKVYINGVLQVNQSAGNAINYINPSTASFEIGKLGSYTTNEFNGNIDEVAIFTSALSSEQISTIATAPSDLSTYNPIAWYRMGDNSTYKTPQILMPENTNKDKVSNYSLSFDGVDDYIATSSLTGLGMGTTDLISVSLWFKTNATKSFPTAFNTGGWPLTSGVNIYLNSTTNNIGARVNNVAITTSGTNYRDDNWHHILLCYNGSLGSNQIELFVDGVSVGTNTLTGNITSTTTDIHIGANTNTSVGTFRGWEDNVDEVAIFNTDQRANISSIYNSGTPTTISGATAYWKLGEQATFSTNWTVPDQVGSNDGTSANMTIEDRVGDASNSLNNAVSFNMEEADIDNDTP
jgi:hypothetical protein